MTKFPNLGIRWKEPSDSSAGAQDGGAVGPAMGRGHIFFSQAGWEDEEYPTEGQERTSSPAQVEGISELPPRHNLRDAVNPEVLDCGVGHPGDWKEGSDWSWCLQSPSQDAKMPLKYPSDPVKLAAFRPKAREQKPQKSLPWGPPWGCGRDTWRSRGRDEGNSKALRTAATSSAFTQTSQRPMVQVSVSFSSRLRVFHWGWAVVTHEQTQARRERSSALSWALPRQLQAMVAPSTEAERKRGQVAPWLVSRDDFWGLLSGRCFAFGEGSCFSFLGSNWGGWVPGTQQCLGYRECPRSDVGVNSGGGSQERPETRTVSH